MPRKQVDGASIFTAFVFLIILFSVNAVPSVAGTASYNLSQSVISTEIGNPAITALWQSSNHFMWVGTQHGLYRFDGADVTHFSSDIRSPIRLPFSDIRGITEDQFGNIIVATFGGGVFRLSLNAGTFQPLSSGRLKTQLFIQHLYHLENGYIVFASDKDLSIVRDNLSQEESWLRSHKLYDSIVDPGGVAPGIGDNIVIGSKFGLYIISPDSKNITKIDLGPIEGEITALIGDRDKNVLFSTSTGLLIKYSLSKKIIVRKIQLFSGTAPGVTDLAIFDDLLWIGTDYGLLRTNSSLEPGKTYHIENSLLFSNHITRLYTEGDSLWIGTFKGLNNIKVSPFFTFNQKNSLVFDDILSFDLDNNGTLWIGTYNGLYYRSPNSLVHKKYLDASDSTISHQPVMAIASHQNETWLGLWRGGVRIINNRDSTAKTLQTPVGSGFAVTGIYHADSTIWISTYDLGLVVFDRKSLKLIATPITEPVTAILNIGDDEFLVASETNLYKVTQAGTITTKLSPWGGAERPPMILSLRKTSHGDIFVGTKDRGLFVWKKTSLENDFVTFSRFTSEKELDFITIYGIEIDEEGYLWCATERGLLRLTTKGDVLSKFTTADGIQGDSFNSGASFRDPMGNIYFGGVNGYSKFFPQDVQRERLQPKMALTRVDIPTSDRIIHNPSELDLIELAHEDYLVSFTFSVLDFTNPNKNRFRYKMEGFDPAWIESGSRNTASYTNLPAGSYTFRALGADSSGAWNLEGISLSLRVLPSRWNTWWAYFGYMIAAVIALRVIKHYFYTRAVKEEAIKEAKEMTEVADKAEDDLQEHQEEQDHLINAMHLHKLSSLELLKHIVEATNLAPTPCNEEGGTIGLQRQLDFLSLLEQCHYYQTDELVTDFNQFTNILLNRFLQDLRIEPETLTTINTVSNQLIPANIASPMAIVLGEIITPLFCQESIEHNEFRCLHIDFQICDIPASREVIYKLKVSDDHILPQDSLVVSFKECPGFNMVNAIVHLLDGTVSFRTENESAVIVSFSSDH